MTVKGDLAAALVSRGKTLDEARELLHYILGHAEAPEFAQRYAQENSNDATEMSEYWRVIAFLKSTV
jgi:hypothetical protein